MQLIPFFIIVTACILGQFAAPDITNQLIFERSHVISGQWWRLISANFLHTNNYHLLLNLSGLFVLWLLHREHYRAGEYLGVVLICSLSTTLGILIFSPQLHIYVGLSGALHGLIIYGAMRDIQHHYKSGWLLLLAVLGKLAYEQVFGANEEVANLIEASVAIDAHLYGAAGGLICLPYLLKKGG